MYEKLSYVTIYSSHKLLKTVVFGAPCIMLINSAMCITRIAIIRGGQINDYSFKN